MPNIFLQPSGLNEKFLGEGLSFCEYIRTMQKLISKARFDLNPHNAKTVIEANSPYEYAPNQAVTKNGILLVHGLFDSPFMLRDLNDCFSQQSLLIRSILLPGHGTVPGDLLHIHYNDWIKAVNYGISSLANEVKNIYVLGFSLGGALALHQAFLNPAIKGIVLFAPALKVVRKFASLTKYYRLAAWINPSWNWYEIQPQKSYAKYESYSCNAAAQVLEFIHILHSYYNQKLNIPLFMVLTRDDETVCYKTALEFFKQQSHPKSKLILYSNDDNDSNDPRIIIRKSAFPSENILHFSHTCLATSPNNCHFGKKGDYFSGINAMYYGSTLHKQKGIQRLCYNPDFNWMVNQINEFLNEII